MDSVDLSTEELRAVAHFAAECAQDVLPIYEGPHPGDPRPRAAVDAAWAFARGGRRTQSLRTTAFAAHRAAREAAFPAAAEAARATGHAAAAAYLHPLAQATQVTHILGAAVHAARASELLDDADRETGARHLERACRLATSVVADVLRRYPSPPPGGGRSGALLRELDRAIRST